jgi:hypothetical protein
MYVAKAKPQRRHKNWTKIDRAKPTRAGGWTSTCVPPPPALRRWRVHTRPVEEEEDAELHPDALVSAELLSHIIWTIHDQTIRRSTSTREKTAHIDG